MSTGSAAGSLGGGPRNGMEHPQPVTISGDPDIWGRAREGESVEQWHSRECRVANAPLIGTASEGRGYPSDAAARAFEAGVWNARLKAGRDAFQAEEKKKQAAEEANRQTLLAQAREAKRVADRRAEEDALIKWHAQQAQQRTGGRL